MGSFLRSHGHCADWYLFHLLSVNVTDFCACYWERVWPLQSRCGKGLGVDQRLGVCDGADEERRTWEVRV